MLTGSLLKIELNFMYAPERSLTHSKDFRNMLTCSIPTGDLQCYPYKASLAERYNKDISDNLRALLTYTSR
jgi:hypothetical protein